MLTRTAATPAAASSASHPKSMAETLSILMTSAPFVSYVYRNVFSGPSTAPQEVTTGHGREYGAHFQTPAEDTLQHDAAAMETKELLEQATEGTILGVEIEAKTQESMEGNTNNRVGKEKSSVKDDRNPREEEKPAKGNKEVEDLKDQRTNLPLKDKVGTDEEQDREKKKKKTQCE